MEKTFRIQFLRKAEDIDAGGYKFKEDGEFVTDETEFDACGTDEGMMMADLINLFNDFISDCGYKDVSVTEVEEVKGFEWKMDRFDRQAWEDIKWTIEQSEYINGNDWFGNFKCGALCWDIVLRDAGDEWLLCADAYLLGVDSGYGYTKDGTPYDQGDSFDLKYDLSWTYEELLESVKRQLDKNTRESKTSLEFASKTDLVWGDD